jgi:hypothetical protein
VRVVVGALRRITKYHYPHGLVELFFFDCSTEDGTAEPAESTGFCWIPAAELRALRFPEANEPILEELARATGDER